MNFKTILSTQAERHQIQVHLDKVDLDVVLEVGRAASSGTTATAPRQTTTTPGKSWTEGADVDSDGFVTHVYTTKLEAAPVSVDTTWSAQFQVAGAATWRPVDGTVTITGAPVDARRPRGNPRARHRPTEMR